MRQYSMLFGLVFPGLAYLWVVMPKLRQRLLFPRQAVPDRSLNGEIVLWAGTGVRHAASPACRFSVSSPVEVG